MNLTLRLGKTPSGTQVFLKDADNPHIFISGQSGSGKSFAIKRWIQQAVRQGATCVAFDYTGDFREYIPPDGIPVERVDVTSPSFTLNPLVALADESSDVRAQYLLSALHSVFQLGSRGSLALRNATRKYLALGDRPSLDGLLEFIRAQKKSGTGLSAALDPLELLASMVHSGDSPISLELTRPRLVVLDFRYVIDPLLQRAMVELILRAIWDQRTSSHVADIPPLELILDECQNLLWGQNSMAIRILREGRKYNIGGWFATQWIGSKNAIEALGQAALRAYFRPDDQNVRQLAKQLCPANGADLAMVQKLISSLKRGQFLRKNSSGKITKIAV